MTKAFAEAGCPKMYIVVRIQSLPEVSDLLLSCIIRYLCMQVVSSADRKRLTNHALPSIDPPPSTQRP